MRLVEPNSRKSLNDDGSEHDIERIKEKLTAFRHDENIVKRALQDRSYTRMIKQIDQRWEKLFADPMIVRATDEPKAIHLQRTKNMIERLPQNAAPTNRLQGWLKSLPECWTRSSLRL